MSDVLLWGDGSEILWGDGTTLGDAVAQQSSDNTQRGGNRSYEARVRAYWDEREELDRRRIAAEREQRERDARMAELQRQQTKLEDRKKLDSRKSAIAKRRTKLAREIEELRLAQQAAQEQIDALVAQIEAFVTEQTMLLDRRRRMVLLLAAAA